MNPATKPGKPTTTPESTWCSGKWTHARPVSQAWGNAKGRPGIYVLYRRQPGGTFRTLTGGKAENLTVRLQSHARSDSRLRGQADVNADLYASYCVLPQHVAALAKSTVKSDRTKFREALSKAERRLPAGPGTLFVADVKVRGELPDVRLEMAEFLYELASELAAPSPSWADSREVAFR